MNWDKIVRAYKINPDRWAYKKVAISESDLSSYIPILVYKMDAEYIGILLSKKDWIKCLKEYEKYLQAQKQEKENNVLREVLACVDEDAKKEYERRANLMVKPEYKYDRNGVIR